MRQEKPRLWIKLRHPVSQQPPDAWRSVAYPAGTWIEICGPIGYPGEEIRYSGGQKCQEWDF